jgi:hypothetical protein
MNTCLAGTARVYFTRKIEKVEAVSGPARSPIPATASLAGRENRARRNPEFSNFPQFRK